MSYKKRTVNEKKKILRFEKKTCRSAALRRGHRAPLAPRLSPT
jgi:hypothetical protein